MELLARQTDELILAPLLGVTDATYRTVYTKHFGGFDRAVAPFVKTIQGGRYKESKLRDLDGKYNRLLSVEPQLISNNIEDFVAVTHTIFNMGYDRINLNLGCPVPMAAGRGRGAGLIPQVDYVDRFLDEVLSKIPCKLSVKTRIGYDDADQLAKLLPVLNRYPLEELAIHPRTAKDLYKGDVNLEVLDSLISDIDHSLIYSGDITSMESFSRLRKRYPQIKKWMIGRGGLRDPFLVPRLKGIQLEQDVLVLIKDFYEELKEAYLSRSLDEFQTLQKLKALWFYQAKIDLIGAKAVKLVRKTKSLDAFMPMVECLAGCLSNDKIQPHV